VRLDEDLEGSYEEGPENIIDHAKRDRRWAQGNLQHSRLLSAPGLRGWSRFVFVQGIMAYVAPLFWAGFLLASIADAMRPHIPDYFPETYQLFPVFPSDETAKAISLAIGILGLLIMPKLSIVLEAVLVGRVRGFGGAVTALASTASELVLSSILAPLMLMYQSRSVLQILAGHDGGWPANNRGDGRLDLADAWAHSRFIVMSGAAGLLIVWHFAPALTIWALPIGVPMVMAPLLIAWSSRTVPAPGTRLFTVPGDLEVPAIVTAHDAIQHLWSATREQAATTDTEMRANYA
jgi:membrane glycosyltransferase